MKPWIEVARPHKDVLSGELQMADFAADISRVAAGTASPEYQDARNFFARTYVTEGMKDLLVSVARRLKGCGGDPVVQLKTNFGGGKTHSLLAVWHLVVRKGVSLADLPNVQDVLAEAGVSDLPQGRVAVIDGTNFSPNQPKKIDGLEIRTLWGWLGYNLLGEKGYRLVEPSDRVGTAPDKDILAELLRAAAPCVVLCDELVAFARQLIEKDGLTAGSFEANMTFVQNLTEAMKAVPNAILLASIPESEEELGGTGGVQAQLQLQKIFARVEDIWKPVGTEESFEIVRRRLFESTGDVRERDETCEKFFALYRANESIFPPDVQKASYLERMKKTYPIHPELFDCLYEVWSTLPKFQKTRGVLQFMAITINRLAHGPSHDPMIMLGSIPLSKGQIEKKVTQYLNEGWDPVIEREIDGEYSVAGQLDGKNPLFVPYSAAQRTARTIFFGSAPSSVVVRQNATRGVEDRKILLGCAIPGQKIDVYEDALSSLRDGSQYLSVGTDRFWYDTRPNLRREMESRKSKIHAMKIEDHLKSVANKLVGRGSLFGGIAIFLRHADIDDLIHEGPRLVVMPPETKTAYARENENVCFEALTEILTRRGTAPRQRMNRLLFLCPDQVSTERLIKECQTYLAWVDLVESVENGSLNIDLQQFKTAKDSRDRAARQVEANFLQCYRFLVCPETDATKRKIQFQVERLSNSAGQAIATGAEAFLKENDLVIPAWSPIHLKKLLNEFYFKNDVEEVSLKKVWEDTCSYVWMPRLTSEDVFRAAVVDGIRQMGFFGYARGRDGEEYLDFAYGQATMISPFDGDMILLSQKRAEELHQKRLCPTCGHYPCTCQQVCPVCHQSPCVCSKPQVCPVCNKTPCVCSRSVCPTCHQNPCACGKSGDKKRFYGTIELDPTMAGFRFNDVMANVVQLFTGKPGVKVTIKVDIEAESQTAFDKNTVIRPVSENCNSLGFSSHGFEEA